MAWLVRVTRADQRRPRDGFFLRDVVLRRREREGDRRERAFLWAAMGHLDVGGIAEN
jgi:hypothetical protein